jgi:hypothetical protein
VKTTSFRIAAVATMAALTVGLLVLAAGPASAHVEEHVGPYHMEVGFQNEPAISGFQNGVFFEVTQASNGQPVNVSDSLKVSVKFGNQSKDLSFEPIPDNPGQYVAAFIPTQPGAYTFAFSGSINGTAVDLSLTSGPDTFDEVQNPTDLQFPIQEPSVTDLSTKLDRETARVTTAAQDAQQSAQAAKDDVSTAKTFGIVGLVVGALGLIVGVAAMVVAGRSRRSSPAASPVSADA